MEIFEIHITGDEKIIEAAQELGIKTIVLDLVKPDKSYFRTEYMTSHADSFQNYNKCKTWVDELVSKLTEAGVNIIRVKIECPYYPQYKDKSLYFEVHYESSTNAFPMSQNHGKDFYLCTAREYDRSKHDALWQKHGGIFLLAPPPHCTMELCLYDTNIEEDKDWFDLYENSI
jgi:hypothetical protein